MKLERQPLRDLGGSINTHSIFPRQPTAILKRHVKSPREPLSIEELPFEILGYIFEADLASRADYRDNRLRGLGQVCQSWRHAAVNHGMLWRIIEIGEGDLEDERGARTLDHIARCMERSQGCPLKIFMSCLEAGGEEEVILRNFMLCLELLVGRYGSGMARWEQVTLEFYPTAREHAKHCLRLLSHPTPRLSSFNLSFGFCDMPILPSTPLLEVLSLTDSDVQLSDTVQPSTLLLGNSNEGEDILDGEAWLRHLRQMNRLQSLEIQGEEIFDVDENLAEISLPSVHTLRCGYVPTPFTSRTRYPNLRTLEVTEDFIDSLEFPIQDMLLAAPDLQRVHTLIFTKKSAVRAPEDDTPLDGNLLLSTLNLFLNIQNVQFRCCSQVDALLRLMGDDTLLAKWTKVFTLIPANNCTTWYTCPGR